jgi:hypothetical protein
MRLVETDLVGFVMQNCTQRVMQTRAITEIMATTTRATTMRGTRMAGGKCRTIVVKKIKIVEFV